MKQGKIILLAFIITLLMSPAVFAMGGPAQEEGQEAPKIASAEAQPGGITKEAVSSEEASAIELAQAQTELTSLEAQREKIDNYLELLSKKIFKAKAAGNVKKEAELQATEHQVSASEKKILARIAVIRNKYPKLQPAVQSETSGSNIVYHDVEMGDTLVSISKKYFGSPDYYREIAKMNNIKDLSHVPQGARLKIDLSLKNGIKPAAVESPKESEIVYHVVAAGDTLMSISREYFDGSPEYYKQIAEMNGLTGYNLKIGMKLKIDKSIKKADQPKL